MKQRKHKTTRQMIWAIGATLGALAFALVVSQAPIASAKPGATIVVNSALDVTNANDGLCTLREATNAIWFHAASGPVAGECPAGTGADTITLPAATYTLTDTSKGKIVLTQSTILNGASMTTTIIQGGAGWSDSILQIYSDSNTQINNVTIRGGNSSGYGGGIYVSGGTLALSNSLITENRAKWGGGIGNYQGTLTMTNSTLQLNNATAEGGGLYDFHHARTVLVNTNVLTNTADWGGGIHNHGLSVLTIAGGNIISNTAKTGSGGGVSNYGQSSISITGTTITKNTATGSSGYGGGISNMSITGTMTVTNSVITNNLASYGAGITSGASGTAMTIDASSINGNIAAHDGGGIFNSDPMTITNSTIANNIADPVGLGGGGAIHTYYTLTLTNTTISTNQAYQGGGIYIVNLYGVRVDTNFVTIVKNQATTAGGIFTSGLSNASLRNTILALNQDVDGEPDCTGTINSLGYNFIGNGHFCTFVSVASDQVGTDVNPLDPAITALANWGGTTMTHGLVPDGPVFNVIPRGTNGCGTTIVTDQRGKARPLNGKCDIGAHESTHSKNYLPSILK
jgi:hypothetical protein